MFIGESIKKGFCFAAPHTYQPADEGRDLEQVTKNKLL